VVCVRVQWAAGAQRPGEMREIGETAVFLASEHASYITGQDITVDGGMMAVGAWANMAGEDDA
jgi:NAD(P)-dependent dehydrogenase (short-subunit alcohol dehydrogenase family)